jgi:hypothetical protein
LVIQQTDTALKYKYTGKYQQFQRHMGMARHAPTYQDNAFPINLRYSDFDKI